MPLVRFGVRNEYGLGVQELYKDGVQNEDPKVVLDGVVVSGLVGLLRQLGDLAQFGAEVFHGLQEQVAYTSSRSRKLVNRVQRIEASLPSIEKAILSQTDHLHFAYTPGTEWHASIRDDRNHFICDDLPHFIMDSYEECREPPRLQLLDRFDTGGPGSCLKRYTDPTFFKRASSCSEDSNSQKSRQERKTHKIKKRSRQKSGHFAKTGSFMNGSARLQFSATGQGQSSLSHTNSTFDTTFKSDIGNQSDSRGSRDGGDFIEIVSRPSISTKPEPIKDQGLSPSIKEPELNTINDFTPITNDKIRGDDVEETSRRASSATWDENLDRINHMNDNDDISDTRKWAPLANSPLLDQGSSPTTSRGDKSQLSITGNGNLMEETKFYYGLNEVPHFLKSNFDLQEDYLKPVYLKSESQVLDMSEGEIPQGKTLNGNVNAQYFLESDDIGVSEKESGTNDIELGSEMDDSIEDGNNVRAIAWDQNEEEKVNEDHFGQENGKVIEWNHLDLGTVDSERVTEGRSNVDVIGWGQMELKTIDSDHDHDRDRQEDDTIFEGGKDVKLIKWNDWELEAKSEENVGQVQVIEWNQNDDFDSGTENFVDAPNTIESESESEFEMEMKKKVKPTPHIQETEEHTVKIGSPLRTEHQALSTSYIQTEIQELQDTILEHEEAENGVFDQSQEKSTQHLSTSYHHEKDDLEQELEKVDDSISSPNLEDSEINQSFENESESNENEKLHLVSEIISLSNVPRDLDSHTNEPEIELEPPVLELKSGFESRGVETKISPPNLSEEISDRSSIIHPSAFWTNGTLLGLQPSKPPIIGLPNSVDSGPTSQNSNIQGINGQDVGPSEDLSHQRSEMTHQEFSGHGNGNGNLRDYLPFLDKSNDSSTLLKSTVKNISSESSASTEDRSSLLSLLSRGLMKNSLRRSGSLGYDESVKSSSPSKSNRFDGRSQDCVVPESQIKSSSPIISPPPSPPLEHMKISFQPVNGFDTSRLKLKYPEGVDHIENNLDAFPSFQLIPESSSFRHGIGSDSDDDTFCRSHAYVSDGSHSRFSDSDSEQWESGNSGEINDPNLYNGLNRISSTGSATISPNHEAENHGNVNLLSGPLFGLTILDGKKPVDYQDMKLCLKPGVDSSHTQEPTHEPPPLPPLQWRVSRPQFDEMEGNQVWGSDNALSQPFVPERSDFDIDSNKLINTVQESSTISTPKKVEEQFGQEQTRNTVNERRMDDGGDFLHQIRTKSFNLKRTEPTRTTSAPLPTTSNKITAILRKANAIRQAVGSDDGEDDSWSDT